MIEKIKEKIILFYLELTSKYKCGFCGKETRLLFLSYFGWILTCNKCKNKRKKELK